MKTLILFLLASVAVAEKIGSFKEFDVHHMSLDASSDAVFNYKFFEDEGESRILNGQNAEPGQFPFVARVSIVRATGSGLCSGSLISTNFGVSASHCVTPNPDTITNIGFLVGTVNRNVAGTTVNTAEFWWLEQPATLVRDLAMFRFQTHVTVSPLIAPIRLPSHAQRDYEFVGWPVTTIGWGRDNTGVSTVHLQWANFRILSIGVCSARFTEYEICYVDDGTDSMTQPGDSGGPVIAWEGGVMTQVGVHAGRRTVSGMTFHSAARLSTFLDWIQEHSGIAIRP